jgi:hypothetical protein
MPGLAQGRQMSREILDLIVTGYGQRHKRRIVRATHRPRDVKF